MFRYVALIWSSSDTDAAQTADGIERCLRASPRTWQPAFSQPGLRILWSGNRNDALRPRPLGGDNGVLLGIAFRRIKSTEDCSASAAAVFEEGAAAKIVATGGRSLIEEYWGNYVAIVRERNSQKTLVVKDATGDLPCFCASTRGVTVVLSSIDDCAATGIRTAVNWEYVLYRAASGGIDEQQPLLNVRQVHRGQIVMFDARRQNAWQGTVQHWTPQAFSETEQCIEDPKAAASALQATTKACIATWAAQYPGILVRLSGGLDSSIVLGCLSRTCDARLVAYTYYNPNRSASDDRRWARIAARSCACRHVEHAFAPDQLMLNELLQLRPTIEPVPGIVYLGRARAERLLSTEHECSAVFSGEGGDSCFGSEAISFALDEFVARRGIRMRVLGLAAQIAALRDRTVWSVLRRTYDHRVFDSATREFESTLVSVRKLVTPSVRDAVARQSRQPHPWFSAMGVSWPTVFRLGALLLTPQYYDPMTVTDSMDPEPVAPLYSQPVVELCLRIPLYTHFFDGRDRGLARAAFKQDVPEAILRRQWKDRAPLFFEALLQRNSDFLNEVLLDGVLVKENVLDRVELEKALAGKHGYHGYAVAEVLNHLDIELWLRSLGQQSQHRAAA